MSHRQDVGPEPTEERLAPTADDLWPAPDAAALPSRAPTSGGRHAGTPGRRADSGPPPRSATAGASTGWSSFGGVPTAAQVDDHYETSKPWLEDLIAEAAAPVVAPPTPLPDPTVDRVRQTPVAAPVAAPAPAELAPAPGPRARADEPVAVEPVAAPDTAPATDPTSDARTEEQRAPAPSETAAPVPQRVEYQPRRSRRPAVLLALLAVGVVAVGAGAWVLSDGSTATTGIAVGVATFTLALLWALLSWTPIVVSVDGSTLRVSRGRDVESFDLRDPDLDVDLHTDGSAWSCTLTRDNGTELVIPASSVDPDEFAAIVRHHRSHLAG